ncbi:MAG: stage II sporulation protein M [Firmicutes bacterium]|nr:stage II sporulation protein M [Bacillota bacterium]
MKSLRRLLLEYFRDHLGIFIFATSFFLAGIVAGALILRFLKIEQLENLQSSFSAFLQSLRLGENLESFQLLKASYRKNISFLALTWFLGLFRPGFPLVLFTLLLKGLALGFTVGFTVYNFSLRGLLFSLAALFPHNIILIPAFLFAATTATAYSYMSRKKKFVYKKTVSNHFSEYCFYMFIVFLFILAGGLFEAYLSPVFMRLVVSFFF